MQLTLMLILIVTTTTGRCEIIESNVSIGHNWCQDADIYEFTMYADGNKVKGRYSFVYVWEDERWKISQHHSSVMPEAILVPSPKPVIEEVVMKEEAEESVIA